MAACPHEAGPANVGTPPRAGQLGSLRDFVLIARSENGRLLPLFVDRLEVTRGDWAGFAQTAIEHDAPGAVALMSVGCGSDSNPSSGVTGDKTAVAAEQGQEIANEVKRLLQGPLKPITGPVTATLQHIDLPLNKLPTREELTTLAASDKPGSYNAKYQLARLERGEPLQSAIDYPIQTWSFDDSLAMVFLAGVEQAYGQRHDQTGHEFPADDAAGCAPGSSSDVLGDAQTIQDRRGHPSA